MFTCKLEPTIDKKYDRHYGTVIRNEFRDQLIKEILVIDFRFGGGSSVQKERHSSFRSENDRRRESGAATRNPVSEGRKNMSIS